MPTPQELQNRLAAIGQSLAESGEALALLGLGSVGVQQERLDSYSDLDFFAIVQPGQKARFINDLGWLSRIAPVAYHFQNTVDGHKLLYADGIFCEFAVFEPDELAHIPFAEGRLIWRAPGVSESIRVPVRSVPKHEPPSVEWLLGEALTCLYVGLGRFHRGEKLSAMRFIQGHAVDRLLELAGHLDALVAGVVDDFDASRRFEQRHPRVADVLPHCMQGYARSCESALAILEFLQARFTLNDVICNAIRLLAMKA